jgi:hypothetical protein
MEKTMTRNEIDFTKIDWEKVGPDKARFFYDEALAHNRGILERLFTNGIFTRFLQANFSKKRNHH